jgi:hypothetical protein
MDIMLISSLRIISTLYLRLGVYKPLMPPTGGIKGHALKGLNLRSPIGR